MTPTRIQEIRERAEKAKARRSSMVGGPSTADRVVRYYKPMPSSDDDCFDDDREAMLWLLDTRDTALRSLVQQLDERARERRVFADDWQCMYSSGEAAGLARAAEMLARLLTSEDH